MTLQLKKYLSIFTVSLFTLLLLIIGCSENIQSPDFEEVIPQPSFDPLRQQIENMGFRPDMIDDRGSYFLVEGDISFDKERLERDINTLTKAQQSYRQYIVNYSDIQDITIKIDNSMPTSGVDDWRTEIQQAVTEWNSIDNNSNVFLEIDNNSSNPDIILRSDAVDSEFLPDGTLGQGEWPTSDGKVGYKIIINLDFDNNVTVSSSNKKWVIVHEIGHNIAFRHTNWSLLQNESGDPGIQIPFTADTDAASVMNGGNPFTTWNGFSNDDIIATRVMYAETIAAPQIGIITWFPLGFGLLFNVYINFTINNATYNMTLWSTQYGNWNSVPKGPTNPMLRIFGFGSTSIKLQANNLKGDYPNPPFSTTWNVFIN